ncbi:HepT-like ribonuclease domain-containing protein [Anaerobaca lacustris]|uniref:HepT-like ribonuclease domain-containing protein n=1 Tax=Anaerobaca lacustris TaxID=3044600 RepID=UPI0032BFAF06
MSSPRRDCTGISAIESSNRPDRYERREAVSDSHRRVHRPRRVVCPGDDLVHDYLGVDLDKVWNVLQNDLPALKVAIDHLLNAK